MKAGISIQRRDGDEFWTMKGWKKEKEQERGIIVNNEAIIEEIVERVGISGKTRKKGNHKSHKNRSSRGFSSLFAETLFHDRGRIHWKHEMMWIMIILKNESLNIEYPWLFLHSWIVFVSIYCSVLVAQNEEI